MKLESRCICGVLESEHHAVLDGHAFAAAQGGLSSRQREALSGFFERGVSTQGAVDRAVRAAGPLTPAPPGASVLDLTERLLTIDGSIHPEIEGSTYWRELAARLLAAPGVFMLTESQRMAITTILATTMANPDAAEVHIDCSQFPAIETRVEDLLALFMRVAPPVHLPPVTVEPLPHLAQALSEVTSEGEARARTSDVALAHSAYYRPPVLTGPIPAAEFTPQVHSTMLEMIGFADAGECLQCGRLLGDDLAGCKLGKCSFSPIPERAAMPADQQEALRWKIRTQILALARKYSAGELGNVSTGER